METPGKRSPIWSDGTQLLEYEFTRDVVKRIADQLWSLKIPVQILVPEKTDIPLSVRVNRANQIYEFDRDSFLVSIHANAGGGTGWEAFTSIGKTKADEYSRVFYEQAEKDFTGWKIRKVSNDPKDPDKDENFYILRKTRCPAILTENFFMDTEKDCKFLLSETGRQKIANMHVETIKTIYYKHMKLNP